MPAQGQEVEVEMEELLLRVVPGLAKHWRGATPEAIAQLEEIAGRPLPSFYRWFLARMGQSMGPLAYRTLDFSAQRVLDCYAEELVLSDSRFLLIAYEANDVMPLHVFYDFDAPTPSDALVTAREAEADADELHDKFETLREMLAWGALFAFRVLKMPQRCTGAVHGEYPAPLSLVEPVMLSLGFTKSISTGPYCGLYERADTVMTFKGIPRQGLDTVRSFNLGGNSAGVLRKVLGEIATKTALKVQVDEWTPELG